MLENKPKSIRIVEVGPRDGLQNEKQILSTEDKAEFINRLVDAGLESIEVTSFVNPKKIPQMADGPKLVNQLKDQFTKKLHLPCLVPNEKGMQAALQAGVKEVAIFTATSNTFNQKNINATIDESLQRLKAVTDLAKDNNIKVRGYISTVFGCPYEGETSIDTLKTVAQSLQQMGVYEISLGDTIGAGNPLQVQNTLKELLKDFDKSFFSMHFHDTRGTALANVLASLDMGMVSFDSSAGGLGGCPYARGATGNLATEDLVYFCNSLEIETGVDMEELSQASTFILEKINKLSTSKYLNAYLARKK